MTLITYLCQRAFWLQDQERRVRQILFIEHQGQTMGNNHVKTKLPDL